MNLERREQTRFEKVITSFSSHVEAVLGVIEHHRSFRAQIATVLSAPTETPVPRCTVTNPIAFRLIDLAKLFIENLAWKWTARIPKNHLTFFKKFLYRKGFISPD